MQTEAFLLIDTNAAWSQNTENQFDHSTSIFVGEGREQWEFFRNVPPSEDIRCETPWIWNWVSAEHHPVENHGDWPNIDGGMIEPFGSRQVALNGRIGHCGAQLLFWCTFETLTHQSRLCEVDHFDPPSSGSVHPFLFAEQNVARFQVSVHDSAFGEDAHCLDDLSRQIDDIIDLEFLFAETIVQRVFQIFHVHSLWVLRVSLVCCAFIFAFNFGWGFGDPIIYVESRILYLAQNFEFPFDFVVTVRVVSLWLFDSFDRQSCSSGKLRVTFDDVAQLLAHFEVPSTTHTFFRIFGSEIVFGVFSVFERITVTLRNLSKSFESERFIVFWNELSLCMLRIIYFGTNVPQQFHPFCWKTQRLRTFPFGHSEEEKHVEQFR